MNDAIRACLIMVLSACTIGARAQVNDEKNQLGYDVLVIGGGASGITAGIQAGRMGASTLIAEETPWLGGMLTAAGVSATDGNYRLYSGLWQEFRERLIRHYGHADSLKTGWVSHVLFEPHQGARILGRMAKAEANLAVRLETQFVSAEKKDDGWRVFLRQKNSDTLVVDARILVDATELGDVVKNAGIPYRIGMDSRKTTREAIAPKEANPIIQDLTYVAILKDYGSGADKTIPRPPHYDPTPFYCTCADSLCGESEQKGRKLWPCEQMMNYGRLPNGYYMINWPIAGNDYYCNVIEMNAEERRAALRKAKQHTLNYIYYLQTELGFKHLGIAEDVFPTPDHLPFIPYHRESRRTEGLVTFDLNDLSAPYEQQDALYRTGIAVGDYPVDHHHDAYPNHDNIPDLHFYPVPSYSVPLGALIPENEDNFIVAEKSISVTNLVNGTTRLQPVCMLIGQAAGALAALAVRSRRLPRDVPVRSVQQALLDSRAYILPYSDINPSSKAFFPLQMIGATGILRGEGKNIGWENHTYIYPDSLLTSEALKEGLADWLDGDTLDFEEEFAGISKVEAVFSALVEQYGVPPAKPLSELMEEAISSAEIQLTEGKYLSRADFAILLDSVIDPFMLRQVNHNGLFME